MRFYIFFLHILCDLQKMRHSLLTDLKNMVYVTVRILVSYCMSYPFYRKALCLAFLLPLPGIVFIAWDSTVSSGPCCDSKDRKMHKRLI